MPRGIENVPKVPSFQLTGFRTAAAAAECGMPAMDTREDDLIVPRSDVTETDRNDETRRKAQSKSEPSRVCVYVLC